MVTMQLFDTIFVSQFHLSDLFIDWEDQKEALNDRCEALNDKYLKVKIPKAELTTLVNDLTEKFEERMDQHDLLIKNEAQAETQAKLIEKACTELTKMLDELAAEIRARPGVCRKLRYGSSDSDSDSNSSGQ